MPGVPLPLVGRSQQLAVLQQLLRSTSQGTGEAAILQGEAGIGKSRLLAEITAQAVEDGFQVLLGATDELSQDRPLAALIEAFGLPADSADPERAAIAQLVLADAVPYGAADHSFRIADAAVSLLERLATVSPVVVAFEDLHWADPATLRAVRAIGAALPHLRVVLLITLRPFPRRPELTRLIEELVSHRAVHLEMPALDDPAVTTLAAAVAGAPPGARLSGQLAGAAGNPLFVIELVEALRDQKLLTMHGGRVEVADRVLPATLPMTILRRTSLLPPATLEVLKVAAVLGREFSVAELATVTGRSAVTLLPELDAALRAGLLCQTSTGGLAFRHELIREAIYYDLAVPLRMGIHREIAKSLTAAGIPLARLADHLFLGASATDPESLGWLRRAAAEAAPRFPAVAVRLCERAFELTSVDDPDHDAIAAELAPLLLQTGRPQDAERIAREVLARGPTADVEVSLRRALGEVLWAMGWLEPAVGELEAVGRVPGASRRGRAGALALAANIRLFVGDRQGARAQAQRARALAPDDDFVCCLAAQTLAIAADAGGEVTEAVALARQAVEIAARSRDPRVGHLHPQFHLGMVLLDADRRDDALAALALGRQLGEQRGNVMWLPLYHALLTLTRSASGELTDALAEVHAALLLADEVGIRLHVAVLHGVAAWIALQQGDIATGEARMIDAAAELKASASQDWQLTAVTSGLPVAGARWPLEWGLWVQALLSEARGDTGRALSLLKEAWELAAPLRFCLSYRFLGPDLVRLAVAAGDRQTAQAVTQDITDGARRARVASAAGAALRCQGLVEDDPDVLLAAVHRYRQAPSTVELPLTCEDAGAALARAGRGAAAVPILNEALDFYLRSGMQRGAARADAALRALGVRRRRADRLRRPPVGWDSLTTSELAVARMAAEGLTNPQIGDRLFISRRTVATHLASVFRKLGITNRVQLAAEVTRRATPRDGKPG
ncbi:MAG TPA: AAA family ATPase [Pseudonocardiaceae bacterium]|nr:AAA family ATPase [Pseudonocardiaceae bacterium]